MGQQTLAGLPADVHKVIPDRLQVWGVQFSCVKESKGFGQGGRCLAELRNCHSISPQNTLNWLLYTDHCSFRHQFPLQIYFLLKIPEVISVSVSGDSCVQ